MSGPERGHVDEDCVFHGKARSLHDFGYGSECRRCGARECNGICLYASDIGVPEAGRVVAYAHPDCPAHGDPQEEQPEADTCGGDEEDLRYVREEDVKVDE